MNAPFHYPDKDENYFSSPFRGSVPNFGQFVVRQIREGAMEASDSISQRIHGVYAQLPNGEKRVAELVLNNPGDVALRTASELADMAGVSNATVSRLFRRLGFTGYDEARRASRTMRARGSPLYLMENSEKPDEHASVAEAIRVEGAVLQHSLEMVNPLVLNDLAQHIAGARQVRLVGFRNSRFLADYLVAGLKQFRPDVEALIPAGQTFAEGLAGLGGDDIVMFIGLRRRPHFFTNLVRAAVSTGANVALLGDESIRVSPALAKWNLTCAVNTPQTVDSYTGAVALLRLIILRTAANLERAGHQHLDRLERLHEELSELE